MPISRSALCAVLLLVGCGGREGGANISSGSAGGSSGTSGGANAGAAPAAVGSGAGSGASGAAASGTIGGSGTSTSGVACADQPTTLVQPFWSQPKISEAQVGDIAVIGTNVYFTLFGPSSLWRVPIGGGQPTMLMSITGEEDAMVSTPTSLVVAESSQGMNAEIVRLSIADGSLSTLAPSNGTVWSLVSDGVDVYFTDSDGVKGVPLGGGSVQTLTSQKGTLGLAGSNVLLADGTGGNIFSIPKTGGALTTVATNQTGAVYPTSCGTDLCWMTTYPCAGVPSDEICVAGQGEAAIVRMPVGASPVTLAQDQLFYGPRAMIFDGSEFFVLNTEDASPDGALSRVPALEASPLLLARPTPWS